MPTDSRAVSQVASRPLELVNLLPLMRRSSGSGAVKIALIDGPVATQHSDFEGAHLLDITSKGGLCAQHYSSACRHGTFIAGILSARRSSAAPAICPASPLLIRSIFTEERNETEIVPSATPTQLATAISDCVNAGARIINMSLGHAYPSSVVEPILDEALTHAANGGVMIVAAAGNQGTLGSSSITRHPWVIPVGSCDGVGRPMDHSNIGRSVGTRGLLAPGDAITSLSSTGLTAISGGTSVATPFVTGTIALLMSLFPQAKSVDVRAALFVSCAGRRPTVVPRLLDAEAAYRFLLSRNRVGHTREAR